MASTNEIISSINELLGDPEYWAEVLDNVPGTSNPPPNPAPQPPPPPRPPRVGTVVQRSDHVNRRKLEMLLQTPPPPPKRRPKVMPGKPADTAPTKQPPPLLMPTGPLPPPPIRVQVEPGIIVEVPHFAVHVARKYKARTPQGR
ncbi:hypothetical protein RF55_21618 [Lasius niger]|uniref:Uncharacterized protein n=2 Tax=Lasius niger TaxID=67767 RepID=A0A0J7JXN1_LASNI|nr:hypothetical protein RF55_21618 [Lasius niger]